MALVGLMTWPWAATVSTEGTDSWEAATRAYGYLFQRPWQRLWYALVSILYGGIVIFAVGFLGSMTVYMAKFALVRGELLVEVPPPGQHPAERRRAQLRVAERVADALGGDRVLVVPGVADERPARPVRLAEEVRDRAAGEPLLARCAPRTRSANSGASSRVLR